MVNSVINNGFLFAIPWKWHNIVWILHQTSSYLQKTLQSFFFSFFFFYKRSTCSGGKRHYATSRKTWAFSGVGVADLSLSTVLVWIQSRRTTRWQLLCWPGPQFEKYTPSVAFEIFSQLSRRNTLVRIFLPDLYICCPDSSTAHILSRSWKQLHHTLQGNQLPDAFGRVTETLAAIKNVVYAVDAVAKFAR